MHKTYTNPIFDYVRSPDQDADSPVHHPVIIVGAGPCGLSAGLDFALQGTATVILDDNNTVSVGSRAICFSKRTLEIMDRYGCANRMVDKGITWQIGKVFFQDDLVYEFNLLPEADHKLPAFINLQQYYFEDYLVERTKDFNDIDLRWKSKVTSVFQEQNITLITVETPDGCYQLSCDYLLVADGANSNIRAMFGLESKGQIFQDRFLIADVVMKAQFPTERWFWFDPPFHPNQSVLLHRQADDVWRIDMQLGWDADPQEAMKEDNIRPRLVAMLGNDVEFNLEWVSVYTFQCRKMDDFVHNRVVFMGDAAHQVSPFGARGANGGVQSVENLAWKLARIVRGEAPHALLQTYNTERQRGAVENIGHSTRATDFITPKNDISLVFRNETLRLAKDYTFARTLVNSGRLSLPCSYPDSPLNTDESGMFSSELCPGSVPKDSPIVVNKQDGWLMNQLGNRFIAMVNVDIKNHDALMLLKDALLNLQDTPDLGLLLVSECGTPPDLAGLGSSIIDAKGLIAERYDLRPGRTYLFRPDQIICGRWDKLHASAVKSAMQKALCFSLETSI